jgi:hypothetical protein
LRFYLLSEVLNSTLYSWRCGMSRPQTNTADSHAAVGDHPVCDYCGGYIVTDGQDCPALDDGRCFP